jgi:hypothetical protein
MCKLWVSRLRIVRLSLFGQEHTDAAVSGLAYYVWLAVSTFLGAFASLVSAPAFWFRFC